MKKALLALVFSAAMIYLPCWIEQANGSFRLAKTMIDVPFNSAWESEPPSPELCMVLARPFFYLGRGAQAFVFASEDGQYVIKLFRSSPKIHPWRQCIRKNFLKRRDRRTAEQKIQLLFGACKLAYTKAPDLTGLQYIHLNATKDLPTNTYLVNRMGRKIPVDLNRCRFAIQKKGLSVSQTFAEAIREKDKEKYLRLANSFVSLVQKRASRNICNLDKKMGENFGFLGETAIEWDFGNYAANESLQEKSLREAEIQIFTRNFQEFLDRTSPDWQVMLTESGVRFKD
jgi:hypothetical protein